MIVAYANDGTKIESDFIDWCLMNVRITDIQNEFGVDEDQAYKMFWDEVRDTNTEEYDEILYNYDNHFNEALGNGAFDEIRNDYVLSLGIEYMEVDENENL